MIKNYNYKIKRKPFPHALLKTFKGALLNTIEFTETEVSERRNWMFPEIYSFSATFESSNYQLIRNTESEKVIYKLTKDSELIGEIPDDIFNSLSANCAITNEKDQPENKNLIISGHVGGWSKKISLRMYDDTKLLFNIHDRIFGGWKLESSIQETENNFPVLMMMFISVFTIARPALLLMRMSANG